MGLLIFFIRNVALISLQDSNFLIELLLSINIYTYKKYHYIKNKLYICMNYESKRAKIYGKF